MDKQLLQPLFKAGMNEEDAMAAGRFLHVALSHGLYAQIGKDLGEEELRRLNNEAEANKLNEEATVDLLENAYQRKMGKTIADTGVEKLEEYIRTLAELMAQMKYDLKKLSAMDAGKVRNLQMALENKDWQKIKEELDKVLGEE